MTLHGVRVGNHRKLLESGRKHTVGGLYEMLMTKETEIPSVFGWPFRGFDGRNTMRSLADALAKLRELDALADGEKVVVGATPLRSPERPSGLVVVLGPRRAERGAIQMPSAASFTARTTQGELRTFDIARLHQARSDADGNVELLDGQFVHQVQLIRSPFVYELTRKEKLILRAALKFLDVEDRCYREERTIRGQKALLYAEVAQIKIEHLKPVIRHVAEAWTRCGYPPPSASVVTKALARAGVQMPRTSG